MRNNIFGKVYEVGECVSTCWEVWIPASGTEEMNIRGAEITERRLRREKFFKDNLKYWSTCMIVEPVYEVDTENWVGSCVRVYLSKTFPRRTRWEERRKMSVKLEGMTSRLMESLLKRRAEWPLDFDECTVQGIVDRYRKEVEHI